VDTAPPADFLLEKIETEPPDDRDFSEIRNAHLYD